jgi:hypothetical protein
VRIGALHHDLPRVEADLLVAPLWAGERPPRGLAGRADWHLCGFISRLMLDHRLRGDAGETILIASQGRIAAPRLLLLGCGPRAPFDADAGAAHAARAAAIAGDLRLSSVALAMPVRDTRPGLRSLVLRIGDLFAAALPPNEGEVQLLAESEEDCERWRAAIRDAFPRGTALGRAPALPRR